MPGFALRSSLVRWASRHARPKDLEQLERKAMEGVRKECPDVEWVGSYAILGPYDYPDVFRTDAGRRDLNASALAKNPRHGGLFVSFPLASPAAV